MERAGETSATEETREARRAQQKAVHERRRRRVPLVGKIDELSSPARHTPVVGASFDDSDSVRMFLVGKSLLIQKCIVHRTFRESSHTLQLNPQWKVSFRRPRFVSSFAFCGGCHASPTLQLQVFFCSNGVVVCVCVFVCVQRQE